MLTHMLTICSDWQRASNEGSFPKFRKHVEFEINEKTRFAHVGQLTFHTSGRANHSHPYRTFRCVGLLPLLCQVRTWCSGFSRVDPRLPAENSQTLSPKTKIVSPCQGWRPLSPGFPSSFEGWGVQGTTKKHCSYPISSRISYQTVISVLLNGLLPRGAERITLACHGVRGVVPLKPLKA